MTESSTNPTPHVGPPSKTKVEKAQSYLGVISTGLGIVGAAGAVFVWLTTTFFLGDVEIKPDKPVDTVVVKVFDKKGQQVTYYGKHVQLMPGNYHLEVGVPDHEATKHADVTVQLWKITEVPLAVPAGLSSAQAGEQQSEETSKEGRKHWWQVWKKRK